MVPTELELAYILQQAHILSNPVFGQIRTTTDEKGNVWFVGKDVAEALGYKTLCCTI